MEKRADIRMPNCWGRMVQTCCTEVIQQSWGTCVIWGSQMSRWLWEGMERRDHTKYLAAYGSVPSWTKTYYRQYFHGNCNLIDWHNPQPLCGLFRRISDCYFLCLPPKNSQWNVDVVMSVMRPPPSSFPVLQRHFLPRLPNTQPPPW